MMEPEQVVEHPMRTDKPRHLLISGTLVATEVQAEEKLRDLAAILRAHLREDHLTLAPERLPLPRGCAIANYTVDGLRAIAAYTLCDYYGDGREGYQTRVDALVVRED